MKTHRYLLFAATVGLTASAMSGAVIYRQGFANDSEAFQKSDIYDWRFFSNASGARIEGTTTSSRMHYFSGSTAVENINALAPHGDNIAQGYWIMNTYQNQLSFTEMTIPRSYEDIAVSFEINNNTSNSSWHVALRFGNDDAWYVSDVSDNISGGWGTFSLNVTDASLWTALVFASGEYMERANPESTVSFGSISGEITAVGFYGELDNGTSSTTHRVDNFTVSAVPEPGAMALGLGVLTLLWVLRRRVRG
jgi:MYXO-CTERM domain-containing protein